MENNEELIYLIVALVGTSGYYFYKYNEEKAKRNKIIRENTLLLADNAKLEADDLKFQLQPHTINNILANLKALSNKLNRGMDALSLLLEYILYHGSQDYVSVEEEIAYIKNYLKMNDLFISQVDSLKIDDHMVNKESIPFRKKSIPHLITGYFLENAFKHGDINHPKFLTITLLLDENIFELTVINKIKAEKLQQSGGVGLSNMRKRLELLMAGKYELHNAVTGEEHKAYLKILF